MAVKGNDVIGTKVISVNNGQEIGKVKDIIYDPRLNKVRALLIDEGGWFSDAKIISLENINSIGQDAVMVNSEAAIRKASEISEKVANIAKGGTYLTKTKVITESGTELGEVTDIFFDPSSGQVQEFEVSEGLVKDVRSGKKRFNISNIKTVGEEAIIVSQYTESMTDEQKGGLEKVVEQGTQKAQQIMQDVKEKSAEAAEQVQNKASEFMSNPQIQQGKQQVQDKFNQVKEGFQSGETQESIKEGVSTIQNQAKEKFEQAKTTIQQQANDIRSNVNDQRKKDAVGKYLTKNLITSDNKMLATQGEIVTWELLNVAEMNGILDEVLNNAVANPL